jgi:hypothetical protein
VQAAIHTVTKANQNKALLWKMAVLGMEKSPVGTRTFCSSQFSRGELKILNFELSFKVKGGLGV